MSIRHQNAAPESQAERSARYSARDVTDKLGIRSGMAVRVVGRGDPDLLERVRAKVGRPFVDGRSRADVVLFWPRSASEVTPVMAAIKQRIQPAGAIWVVSAKKGGEPYLPDSQLIPLGLAAGLVDNKICSVSGVQSAMRFVIRRTERQ